MRPANSPQSDSISASQARRVDGQWEGIAHISGMDCGACAVELEQAARRLGGFSEFAVNPASHLARWVAATPTAIDALALKAHSLGYVLGLQDDDAREFSEMKNRRLARSRFLRFLVAALCMMQIMMYSTPEYIFSAREIGLAETGLLRWAQWVLALPLMLYCAAPYYKRAWVAMSQGRLVMDQPIVLGLLLAFVLSSLNLGNPVGHVWFDSIAMLLTLLLLVQMLVDKQSALALNHLAGLQPDFPMQVDALHGDEFRRTPVAALQAGQAYRLQSAQAVPVDSELMNKESTVWVDEAMRTGEADPVSKKQGDLIQAGSRILGGQALLRALPITGGDSLNALGQLLLQALAAKPAHQDKVDRILPWFVSGILVCALLTALYWAALRNQPDVAAGATVAVLIVTCPCALALALPLVRLFGIRRLADTGVLVRNPQALDILAKISVVALDKTGTLTSPDSLKVVAFPVDGHAEICDAAIFNALYMLARRSVHPLSKAVALHLFGQLNAQAQPVQWLHCVELPGAGLTGVFKLHDQCVEVRLGSALHCELPVQPGANSQVFAVCVMSNSDASRQAIRFSVELEGSEALVEQLEALQEKGLSLNILSGDLQTAVEHWMPELEMDSRLGGMSPEQKINWIAARQAEQQRVLMVGDGLNDSGAFGRADVSFAAAGASTLSASQADFLLLKPGLAGLVAAVNTARLVDTVGRQNLIWALAYNGVAVPVAAMGLLTPWMASVGMGLSSLLVFLNALRVKQGR